MTDRTKLRTDLHTHIEHAAELRQMVTGGAFDRTPKKRRHELLLANCTSRAAVAGHALLLLDVADQAEANEVRDAKLRRAAMRVQRDTARLLARLLEMVDAGADRAALDDAIRTAAGATLRGLQRATEVENGKPSAEPLAVPQTLADAVQLLPRMMSVPDDTRPSEQGGR